MPITVKKTTMTTLLTMMMDTMTAAADADVDEDSANNVQATQSLRGAAAFVQAEKECASVLCGTGLLDEAAQDGCCAQSEIQPFGSARRQTGCLCFVYM